MVLHTGEARKGTVFVFVCVAPKLLDPLFCTVCVYTHYSTAALMCKALYGVEVLYLCAYVVSERKAGEGGRKNQHNVGDNFFFEKGLFAALLDNVL